MFRNGVYVIKQINRIHTNWVFKLIHWMKWLHSHTRRLNKNTLSKYTQSIPLIYQYIHAKFGNTVSCLEQKSHFPFFTTPHLIRPYCFLWMRATIFFINFIQAHYFGDTNFSPSKPCCYFLSWKVHVLCSCN